MDYGDRIDRNLVSILEGNARTPASELARRVGLARSSVQERLERLERRGVILGYRAIVGRAAQDQSILAYLFLTLDPRHFRHLFAQLRDYPEIVTADVTSGAANALCRVSVPHLEDLEALVGNLAEIEGIEAISYSVVLSQKINRADGLLTN
jgi:DNA-binding Lrp family transcriptional regulator